MAILDTLTLAEQAKQLGNPEGPVGLAVADWTSENNKQGYAQAVGGLGIKAGNRVLEIGFGNGRAVPNVIGAAPDVRYTGIDISPTMVDEAARFNASLVSTGRASFHLAAAEQIPFPEASFDRVFSIGVVHFWLDPVAPLREVRRVLSRSGAMLMGCLAPPGAPAFARTEYGFHLRDAAAWEASCREAGFNDVNVAMTESQQTTPAGAQTKRYVIRVAART